MRQVFWREFSDDYADAQGLFALSVYILKSPNVIRLKEFSKKYENFLFVEVINRWIGRLKGCQDGVANFVFYDSGLTKNIYYNEYL